MICEKPLGRDAAESYETWQRVAATGVKHMCAFNYRFVPAVRLAREIIESGELGEIQHFRGCYLQEWGTTEGEHLALRQGGRRLGRARRPRRARDRPRPLPRRRDRGGRRRSRDLPARAARSTTRSSPSFAFDERRRRHDRGVALLPGSQERTSRGRSTARRARSRSTSSASTSCRSLPQPGNAGLPHRARVRGRPPVLGALVAAGPHHRLGALVRARAAPPAHGDPRRRRRGAARRDARGRLPRGRDLRRDAALGADRRARERSSTADGDRPADRHARHEGRGVRLPARAPRAGRRRRARGRHRHRRPAARLRARHHARGGRARDRRRPRRADRPRRRGRRDGRRGRRARGAPARRGPHRRRARRGRLGQHGDRHARRCGRCPSACPS